jgi:hypothetical protein
VSDHRYLWIFSVVGGESFVIQPKGNPRMKHDGTRSVLRCLCTDAQAEELTATIKGHGGKVVTNSPRESPEQRVERNNVFAVLGPDVVWPTNQCPQCAWLDPTIPGMCGAGMLRWKGFEGWDRETILERLAVDKFETDRESCPLASMGDSTDG